MPWCMPVSLTRGGGENVPDFPVTWAKLVSWQNKGYRDANYKFGVTGAIGRYDNRYANL